VLEVEPEELDLAASYEGCWKTPGAAAGSFLVIKTTLYQHRAEAAEAWGCGSS
jgi:hypothetical protein